MSKEDDERFWNLLIYKIYATDKELDEVLPVIGIVILVVIVIAVIVKFVT